MPKIILLQGPVGGFFRHLQTSLDRHGFETLRVLFNGGDEVFCPSGVSRRVLRYAGGDPAGFFKALFASEAPDAILLFGDERPIHIAARRAASAAGIPVWSFEEGYIRPDWVTFEPVGNNANTRLAADFAPNAPIVNYRAAKLPNATRRMAMAAFVYFTVLRTTMYRFPLYRHHRDRKLTTEHLYWLRAFLRKLAWYREDQKLEGALLAGDYHPFFILALQVHDDLQLLRHGNGWRNRSFLKAAVRSFLKSAPADCHLVVKAHPLDIGYGHHRTDLRNLVVELGGHERVHYLQTGSFMPLVRQSRGVVTINSTSGLAALAANVPVLAFGKALYTVPGLCAPMSSLDDLDAFWNAPPKIAPELANSFIAHVRAKALVPGSFYLSYTWPGIAAGVVSRLDASLAASLTARATDLPRAERQDHSPVGIASFGLWRKRKAVSALLGAPVVPMVAGRSATAETVVGWGRKASGQRARAYAAERNVAAVYLEDGFLRSVRPDDSGPQIGWVVDRQGVYYDSAAPSDFEAAVLGRIRDPRREDDDRARAALAEIARLRLSKYNSAPMRPLADIGLPGRQDVVYVIDQVAGDASVACAGADALSFRAMLDMAIAENPGRTIAVKAHPQAISGRKTGYLVEYARSRGVRIVAEEVNPWTLIETALRVYTVSSLLGFEAALAGVPVTTFGAAFYAGWGLTDDRGPVPDRRVASARREDMAAAAYFDYCRWLDPYGGGAISFEEAVDRLAFLRDRFLENKGAICVGISRWKQPALRHFLDGAGGSPLFAHSPARAEALSRRTGRPIVSWPSKRRPTATDVTVINCEDGFLRSAGLGAALVPPSSLVFDRTGIYYNAGAPSDFETLAETGQLGTELVARAARLREAIVVRRLSKYNEAPHGHLPPRDGRRRILVPGQVEDDASILRGSPVVRTNLDLLERVRRRNPDAEIVYKPHPDVVARLRKGVVDPDAAARLADHVVIDTSMASLLEEVDAVETMTSLTGFEALLRGVPVTTHGLPFYAGWGLTESLLTSPRRTRRLSLDELVAVALILYPRYVDPVTGLPCPPELLVDRLTGMKAQAPSFSARVAAANRRVRGLFAAATAALASVDPPERRERERPR